MAVTWDALLIGETYGRPELAALWGYRDWHAIGRGIVTPANEKVVVLFVTEEKQDSQVQYRNHFDGDRLHMDGETNHANDMRLMNSQAAGDSVLLFHRSRHHCDFTFYGLASLLECQIHDDQPSKFLFQTERSLAIATSCLRTEQIAHGSGELAFSDLEGKKKYALHVTYERSPDLVRQAIRIHGSVCKCCGFDFNRFYGPELARAYIEIHHVESIASGERQTNPALDLIPLCSNCHSMVHRKRGEIIPVDELRNLLRSRGAIQ